MGFCGSFSNNELIFVKNTCTNRPETWSVGHIGHEKAHGEMVRPDVASEAIRRLN